MMNDKKRDRHSRQSNPPTPDRSNTQRRKTDGFNDTNIVSKVDELAKNVNAVAVGNKTAGGSATQEMKQGKDHTDLLIEPIQALGLALEKELGT